MGERGDTRRIVHHNLRLFRVKSALQINEPHCMYIPRSLFPDSLDVPSGRFIDSSVRR